MFTLIANSVRTALGLPQVPVSSDLSVPVVPIPLPPTVGVGTVTHSWFAACDKHDGTNAASGIANYIPNIDGSTLGAITAPNSEILGNPTNYTIGGPTPSPVYTRIGTDCSISCGWSGNISTSGFEGTSDCVAYRAWACTNVQVLSAIITSLSSANPTVFPNDYSGGGIMFRDSSAAGSKFIALYYGQNGYVFMKWRTTTNGAVFQAYAITDGSFGLLYLVPNGDGTFSGYRQTAGQDRQLIHTTTTSEVSLASTGLAGVFAFGLSADAVTSVFSEIALRSSTPITKTTSATVAVLGKLKAVDAATPTPNESAYSAVVSATPTTSATVKWNPTDFIGASKNFSGETEATVKSRFDLARTHTGFGGGYLITKWSDIETAPGVYDWTLLDNLINYLNNTTIPGRFNVPKVFGVEPWATKFAVSTSNPYTGTQPYPQYVIDNGWVDVRPSSWDPTLATTVADLRIPGCYAAYKALFVAMAARYNSNASFEIVELIGETDQQPMTVLLTLASEVKPYWPNTNVGMAHNWVMPDPGQGYNPGPQDQTMKNSLVASLVATGGPDMPYFTATGINGPSYESDGQLALRGAGIVGGYNYGTINSCGVVPNKLGREVVNNTASGNGDDSAVAAYCVQQKTTHRHWWFDNDSGDYNGHASFSQLVSVIALYPPWSGYPTAYTNVALGFNQTTLNRVFQRTGTTADVDLTGSYTGTFTDVQARVLDYNTGAEVLTWAVIDSSLSSGVWSGTMTGVPQGGPYKFEIRPRIGTTPLASIYGTTSWYVGALFGLIGDSIAELWASNYGGMTANATVGEFNSGVWQNYGAGIWHTPFGPGVVEFLNAVNTELGIPIAMIPYAVSGTTVDQWNDGYAEPAYSNFMNQGVIRAGGKLEGVVAIVGLNDAPSIVSRATHLTSLRLLRDTVRTDLSQATLKWYQLGSGRYGSGTDAKFNFLHQAESDFGADSNTYLASSIGIPQESDQLHPTFTGMREQGKRVALLVADAVGNDTFSRGPYISSVSNVDSTHTDVNITHRGGTDFTPTSGITGFQISDNAWSSSLTISAAVRQSATSIRLTHTSAGGTRVVRYMWGAYPNDSGYVKDNTTLNLPLEFNAD